MNVYVIIHKKEINIKSVHLLRLIFQVVIILRFKIVRAENFEFYYMKIKN